MAWPNATISTASSARLPSRFSPASDTSTTADAPSDTCEQSLTFMNSRTPWSSRKVGFLSEARPAISSVILTACMCAFGFLLALAYAFTTTRARSSSLRWLASRYALARRANKHGNVNGSQARCVW